jgi:cell division transport system permease protein
MANKLGYLIKEGVKGTWKNRFMTVASVGVLVACLLIMGSFTLISANINNFIQELESENEIAVYIDETVSREDALAMQNEFESLPYVATVTFESKEDAWEEHKKSYPNSEELFEGVENPLRDSYILTLTDLTKMHETVQKLETMDNVANVRGREDISQNLVKLKNMLAIIMLSFFAVLVCISLFIISNTIKLGMFARRKEINIMKYVGATNAFIRLPFQVEGIIIGLVSGGIAFGLQWYTYSYLMEKVMSNIELINMIPFSTFLYPLLGIFLGAGFIVGLLGSGISIRKYMNV